MGSILAANFAVFWAIPVFGMGQVWKLGLYRILRPIFNLFDQSTLLRSFAKKYIYSKELYTDFFALSVLLAIQNFAALGVALYWQVRVCRRNDVAGLPPCRSSTNTSLGG